MRTAHFFKAKQSYLIISATTRPVGTKHNVTNKKEARQLAQLHGAKVWNF